MQALAEGDRDAGLRVQSGDCANVLGEEGLFDEERMVRCEGCGELLGHGPVDAAVEIHAGVHGERFHCRQACHGGCEHRGRVQPCYVGCCVHFYRVEALGFAGETEQCELATFHVLCVFRWMGGWDLRLLFYVVGSVAADPGVDFEFVADFAAEELVDGHV